MKTINLILFFCAISTNAQNWSLTGNSSTNPLNNFIGTTDNQDLVLKTNNSERLRISTSGNIGIGLPPKNGISLSVNGRGSFENTINSDTFYIGNSTENVDRGNDLLFLRYTKFQPQSPGVIMVSGMISPTEYATTFRLTSDGKLGMGTVNTNCAECTGYRLFVKDGIRTEKIKVDIASENGWADYVFENNYELKNLKDLENYIKINKHLPEVPSTEEAIKNGIELKEMNILLLKKVEELTLYIIEQNKRIEKLENK